MATRIAADQNYGGVSRIYGLPEPSGTTDAATKSYVDTLISGLGGVVAPVAISANWNLSLSENTYLVNASSESLTGTLPPLSSNSVGKTFQVKKMDSTLNAIKVIVNSPTDKLEFVVNGSVFLHNQGDSVTLYCASVSEGWIIL